MNPCCCIRHSNTELDSKDGAREQLYYKTFLVTSGADILEPWEGGGSFGQNALQVPVNYEHFVMLGLQTSNSDTAHQKLLYGTARTEACTAGKPVLGRSLFSGWSSITGLPLRAVLAFSRTPATCGIHPEPFWRSWTFRQEDRRPLYNNFIK